MSRVSVHFFVQRLSIILQALPLSPSLPLSLSLFLPPSFPHFIPLFLSSSLSLSSSLPSSFPSSLPSSFLPSFPSLPLHRISRLFPLNAIFFYYFRKLDENENVEKESRSEKHGGLSGVILPARNDDTLFRPSNEEFNQLVWIDRSSTPSEGTRHADGVTMVNGDTLKPGMESPPPSPSKAVDQIEKLLNTQETWDDSSEDEDKETVKETQDQEYVVLSKSASREDLGDEGGSLYQRLSRTFSDDVDYTHQESLLEEDEPVSSVEIFKQTDSKSEARVQSPLVLQESDQYIHHYDKEFGEVNEQLCVRFKTLPFNLSYGLT